MHVSLFHFFIKCKTRWPTLHFLSTVRIWYKFWILNLFTPICVSLFTPVCVSHRGSMCVCVCFGEKKRSEEKSFASEIICFKSFAFNLKNYELNTYSINISTDTFSKNKFKSPGGVAQLIRTLPQYTKVVGEIPSKDTWKNQPMNA